MKKGMDLGGWANGKNLKNLGRGAHNQDIVYEKSIFNKNLKLIFIHYF